jgi:biopolymer transport protein ExbD
LNGERVSKDELANSLRTQPSDTSFLIRADRDLTFQKFIDVADILKRLNFTKGSRSDQERFEIGFRHGGYI